MPVYLIHPDHGTHIAYDIGEVERCKLNGWKLRDEAPKAAPVTADVVNAADVVWEKAVEKRKPGRPKKA